MKLIEYATPKIVDPAAGYVLMLCQFGKCAACSRLMVPAFPKSHRPEVYLNHIWFEPFFPLFLDFNLEAQMKRADLVFRSSARDKAGLPICERCAQSGMATFVCHLCRIERSSSQLCESFGSTDTAEHLCSVCYETVPAKRWDAAVEELRKSHQYDSE